jgi:carbon-monoxide dehydrogenase large subunit
MDLGQDRCAGTGRGGALEIRFIPAAAAVISAIEDALSPFHVHIAQMPVMPHKLVELIAQGRAKA